MFCFSIKSILSSFTEHQSELLCTIQKVIYSDCAIEKQKIYQTINKIPIDIAIFEKAKNVVVLPVSFTWSDVGNWYSLSELLPKDENNNHFQTESYSVDSSGNSVFSDKFTAMIGVSDLLIIDTEDALLIVKKDKAEQVKEVVDYIKMENKKLL